MTVLIVGEAPSRSSDPKRPFDGYSGKKLAEYAGLSGYEELSHAFRLRNLMQRWPGVGHAGEKGSRFPMVRAKRAARRFDFEGARVVLLAGKRVAKAFGLSFDDYYAWKSVSVRGRRHWICLIPHTSGCNRYFNYAENRRSMEIFMRSVLVGARLACAS